MYPRLVYLNSEGHEAPHFSQQVPEISAQDAQARIEKMRGQVEKATDAEKADPETWARDLLKNAEAELTKNAEAAVPKQIVEALGKCLEGGNFSLDRLNLADLTALAIGEGGRNFLLRNFSSKTIEKGVDFMSRLSFAHGEVLDINFGNNGTAEMQIGAGDILPPTVRDITVKSAKTGEVFKGYRAPDENNPTPQRPGYYTEDGNYVPIFSGDKVEIGTVFSPEQVEEIERKLTSTAKANKAEVKNDQQSYEERFAQAQDQEKMVKDFEQKYGTKLEAGGNKQEKFIGVITPIAQEIGRQRRIPWQAIAVMAAHESGYNLNAGTLFGIKASRGQKGFESGTWEVRGGKRVTETARFADFGGGSPIEKLVNSCVGYCDFLERNGRYAPALASYRNGGTPDEFIRKVWEAGYATDPNYMSSIRRVARDSGIDIYSHDGVAA